MAKPAQSLVVPKPMQATYEAVVALTDAVCRDHLGDEYRDLARAMTATLCRKRPSPLASGQPRVWACAIVYALGQINFLTDRSTSPFMSTEDLCAAFGVGQSTAGARAKTVRDLLKTRRLDPAWTLPSQAASNPLQWMAQVNGMVVDLRFMPRDVQVIAFEKGMIPYIPDDASQDDQPD